MLTIEANRVVVRDDATEGTIILWSLPDPGHASYPITCEAPISLSAITAKELKALGGALRGMAQKLLDQQRSDYLAGRRRGGVQALRTKHKHQS